MTPEQQAVFIFSQSVAALVTALGMTAANMQRQTVGHSMAYDDFAFAQLIEKYGLEHNAVLTFFQGK